VKLPGAGAQLGVWEIRYPWRGLNPPPASIRCVSPKLEIYSKWLLSRARPGRGCNGPHGAVATRSGAPHSRSLPLFASLQSPQGKCRGRNRGVYFIAGLVSVGGDSRSRVRRALAKVRLALVVRLLFQYGAGVIPGQGVKCRKFRVSFRGEGPGFDPSAVPLTGAGP